MTTLRRWWDRTPDWAADLAEDEAGDLPGWAVSQTTYDESGTQLCLR
jgi:hypothetical protein